MRSAFVVLIALSLATLWYAGATRLLERPSAELIGLIGAVMVAALAPVLILGLLFQRQLRHLLAPMEQRLQALDAHAVVSIVDGKGRLTSVNDKLLSLTGHSRAALLGQPVGMLYPDSETALAKHIRKLLSAGETWHGETPLQRADGSIVHTQATVLPLKNARGDWDGSISVRTDITSVKQLRAERKTMEVLDELRDDIWIIDCSDWRFNYMNNAARKRLGCVDEAIGGRSLEAMTGQPEFEPIISACRSLKSGSESATRFEIVHDGVPLHVSVKLVNDVQGSGFFLILMSDISDRVAQDRQKSEFVATVSHELRSPLTSIKGALSLLLSSKSIELPKNARDLLAIAHRNSDRLILIINDILDLEKIANGEMHMQIQDVDMAELLGEARNATAMMGKSSSVEVEIRGADQPLPIRTDPNRLMQVLTNLLSNACKFSGESGKVLLSLQDNGDHIRVSVQDDGPGIPADEQHKIFQRFADMTNSDRAAKGGTGLGLSICKAIVESLDGTIGFRSREGIGTEFYFTLPQNSSHVDVSQITQFPENSTERRI